ncbi:erythroid differentiation-related factor 1 [Choristoneura fumiferana]|uniref:erythroid differentiation-related factor 1 n=1 Tax=Choristoneura fumiferana TaxID=7141 RepID=UPI003D153E00
MEDEGENNEHKRTKQWRNSLTLLKQTPKASFFISRTVAPSPGIKSTAVVKYTAFPSPVSYSRLQCNTDLNLPPSNWGAAADSYGLKQILAGSTGLSSFRMAHMFPDCVGSVDVVSGAECIKKLLKLPYQPNGTVSMMVHRVENTLLLDEFDVYDYLTKSEWSWLKDFFIENILKTMSEKERMSLAPVPPPRTALQLTHQFLTRQFLSHSVCGLPQAAAPEPGDPAPGPFLPEPETRSEPPNEHLYNRNVLWTFEDIQMLIGSDLPIFGDKDRPCVSLRLRDAREPINVLTGIDYWLDNLMCNVPEVLMCYHIDGIVQKYEPMKTEELPNMENSKFSPKVVRNVAQNILSFLKHNATKAGHTYWLFKGPRDDVVKLYDLTSLCPDSLDNSFTTPVAMLLYRVARNMRMTNRSKHVKQLLEHAIKLLEVGRYPQIVASSHYMLADLYVPATTNPACPDFKDESSDSDNEEPDFDEPTEVTSERDAESVKDETENEIAGESGDKENVNSDKTCDGETDIDKCDEDITANEGDGIESGGDGDAKGDDDKGKEEKSLALQMRGLALRDIGDRRTAKEGEHKRAGRGGCGLGVAPPTRCGAALTHALKGLLALHSVTIHKCKEEERERLKEQILIEEQHPKMANPYEPISLNFEPIKKIDKPEQKSHSSRSRRRKKEKKNEQPDQIVESNSIIDKNAILVRNQKKLPSWHEPNRDDNFAWKLHLKTLLYEKICLAYATLAEYSYAREQYGFSLKYIDLASKCQKLLSNMIIKSKVVDSSALIGRVGDNFFQWSKKWQGNERFRRQFETDHDVDTKIRMEIANDFVEEVDCEVTDEFDLKISLPATELDAMLSCCSYYRLALTARRDHRDHRDHRDELRRRLASVSNELGVRYMNDAQLIYNKYIEEDPSDPKAEILLEQFKKLSQRSLQCLDEAAAIFQQVNDVPNLALLYCNKGRYMRFKAHCDEGCFDASKRNLYQKAEDLYMSALKLLSRVEASEVKELVQWELSSHLFNRAVLMQDTPNYRPSEPSEVAEAFRHALKHCQLSPGPRQDWYQFRAGKIHHRVASLYHAQYRVTEEEGPRRRSLLSSARTQYLAATHLFALLNDTTEFLTAQLEHVALCEMTATLTPNLKLKSLQNAVQLLRQSHSIMKVIRDRAPEDQKETKEDQEDKPNMGESELLKIYVGRLHFILKSIIQYCRSKSNKDYEKMTDNYKKLYCASLKIKEDEDVRLYAGSICDVLEAMDAVSTEIE